jgi:uncharacterized protein (DUF302 family)
MTDAITVVTRPVRHIAIESRRPYAELRAAYEEAVPQFDRLEAIGVVLSNSGWEAIRRLSAATATHGMVNFFTFDPSPVMAVNGNASRAVTYLSGNIVEAERGFANLSDSFLYIPLRVVIAADEGGNARLRFDHPADLFAAFSEPGLDKVAHEFALAFAAILERISLPVPTALRG